MFYSGIQVEVADTILRMATGYVWRKTTEYKFLCLQLVFTCIRGSQCIYTRRLLTAAVR